MAQMDVGNQLMWHTLKYYLPSGTRLTSVYRPAAAQLEFIVRKAKKHGYAFAVPPAVAKPLTWRGAPEFVRGKGYKVAAPGESRHQSGLACDLAGPDLSKIEAGVRKAVADGRITL